MVEPIPAPLAELALLYGVHTSYDDIWGQSRPASSESLLAVLRSLGAPVASLDDVSDAVRQRRYSEWQRLAQPVVVGWAGTPVNVELRLPAESASHTVTCTLRLEDGRENRWTVSLTDTQTTEWTEVEGASFVGKRIDLGDKLPLGYHRLEVELDGGQQDVLIIYAPQKAWSFGESRRWGVFLPLHALRSSRSQWGGSFGDLERLMAWTGHLGGSLVGTLPLLASYLDSPFDPSPYSPVSRLFWNELFLDVDRLAQGVATATAPEQPTPPTDTNHPNRIDYRAWAAHQAGCLDGLARAFFDGPNARSAAFDDFLGRNPRLQDYAEFRAAVERQRAGWISWPEPMRSGQINEGDFDPERLRYHAYVQWLLEQQLQDLSDRGRQVGTRLYLDFPLGVHPDSYDVWRERDSFANGIAVGAPPDLFFTAGQDWGFPPLHPESIREHGYRYFIEAVRNHTRFAGALRIDHVMGLQRLFWIPHGMGAREGVYVNYRADEMYAILALESQRAECLIVGEDLGTVPDAVRAAMDQHDFLRMYVAQFEMTGDPDHALNPVPRKAMASLNTHDTVLYAGFGEGLDIDISGRLGLIEEHEIEPRHYERREQMAILAQFLRRAGAAEGEASSGAVLHGSLAHLAASDAQALLVTLEDLWLEVEPQNVPGTGDDWGNWRRKALYSFEQFSQMPEVVDVLRTIDRLRKQDGDTHD